MKRATNVVLVLLLAMGVTILMTARTIAITARTPITTHIGFANTSCGSWTQARANHRSTHMEFWVIGFMSGVNYARSDWCSHRLSQCWAPQGGGSAAILGLPRGSVTILEERQGGMPRRAQRSPLVRISERASGGTPRLRQRWPAFVPYPNHAFCAFMDVIALPKPWLAALAPGHHLVCQKMRGHVHREGI